MSNDDDEGRHIFQCGMCKKFYGRKQSAGCPHPLVDVMAERHSREDAFRLLIETGGNAFGVGIGHQGLVIMNLTALCRPLHRTEISNLIAWLTVVGDVDRRTIDALVSAIQGT